MAIALSLPFAEPASAMDGALCEASIGGADQRAELPPRLLGAIGIVESGRIDPATRRLVSWPWTINALGQGHFYETKADAIAAAGVLLAGGTRSIDVGCMQVNLMHHPAAFASLEQAFDPETNVAYAVRFLKQLRQQTGSWPAAAAAYHSQTPELGAEYARRVSMALPPGLRFAVPPSRPGVAISNVYTAEFARVLAQDAADRASRGTFGAARSVLARPSAVAVYTPEFARVVAQDAAMRSVRLAAVRGAAPGGRASSRDAARALANAASPARGALRSPG